MATTEGIEQEPRRGAERHRRFGRRGRSFPRSPRVGVPITEGTTGTATSFREGLYRRSLALADGLVAAALV